MSSRRLALAKFLPFGEVTEEFFLEHTAINVKGTFFTAQKALPLLSEGASIIFTSSTGTELLVDGGMAQA